jgi:pimeloyl-ACP methyl ester carboxylesterase
MRCPSHLPQHSTRSEIPVKALVWCVLILLAAAPLSSRAEMARVNGVALHYTVQGSGDPLLLLHGFGSCGASWADTAQRLAQKYKVITVDARGHGTSTNPAGKFRHDQAADDIRALLDELKISNTRAMGFSSGGITLLHLATRNPERLSKMIVVAATTGFPEQARAILQSAAMDTLPPDVLASFRKCAARGEPQVRALVDQFRAFGFSTDDTDFQAADLGKITAKTLIVHGDRDLFFPVSIPVGMYAGIKDAALWIVPNGDHSPTAGAAPEDFMQTAEGFLAD